MKREQKMELSDAARANLLGRKLELFVILPLTLSYVTQGAKNSISTIGLIAIMLALWVPVAMSAITYKKNPESPMIRHIIGIGYGIFYLMICFISEQRMVFVYAFPMLIVITIYCDYKFSITVSSSVIVIALAHAVLFTVKTGFTAANVAAMEMEIAASVLVGVYCIITNKYVIGTMNKHLNQAKDAGIQTEHLLSNVMDVSNALADEVHNVSEKIEVLSRASSQSLEAMTEVQHGTADSATSVQNQMLKTEEIQNQITQVSSVSDSIGDSVNESVVAIDEGRENVKQLMEYAENSEEASNVAMDQLTELKEFANQMGSIVALIQSVAVQTNLLSLNASIEAARAGEAGRGFAVVASEISNLASQTQDATANINELIGNVASEVDNVAEAITKLVESNQAQTESVRKTATSFERIADNNQAIHTNSASLSEIVNKLDAANKDIIENIQTVSAVTEEVSANSTITFEKTEETENIVQQVKEYVEAMSENAAKLKNLS